VGVVNDVICRRKFGKVKPVIRWFRNPGKDGHNDWLEGMGHERFLEKLFEFESDGIFRFGGWRENCIVDREMWGLR